MNKKCNTTIIMISHHYVQIMIDIFINKRTSAVIKE